MSGSTQSVVGIAVSLVLGGFIAWAGSDGGATVGGVAVFALCALLAFAVNWVAFIPAYKASTERFYDLTGSCTYLTLLAVALFASGRPSARSVVLALAVGVWAVRLGSFLFRRVRADGGDGRFDKIKLDPLRFLMTWTLQGLWVLVTLCCALAAITTPEGRSFGLIGVLGLVVWIVGFAIEVTADRQKADFRSESENSGRFITSGLWAWSRHPNYFGEVTLWLGIAIMAAPVLDGWQWVTLISPVFVYVLLTKVSGLPMLEARAEKRWGEEPAFRHYTAVTPAIFPKPPSSK